jgi:hypothetical protein
MLEILVIGAVVYLAVILFATVRAIKPKKAVA